MSEQNSSISAARPKILALLGCYLPGFNSGGPVRTVSCMVEALAPFFDWKLVTLNHDSGSTEIYSTVRTGEWNRVGSGDVFYIPKWNARTVQRIAHEVQPDIIYLNGFFSTSSICALLARKRGMLPQVPVVLATRGDLAGGALGLKILKKRGYMKVARGFSLYSGLHWHASSDREKSEILSQLEPFGVSPEIVHVAPDLGFGYKLSEIRRPEKHPGSARFVTLGRIVRMKNPLFTLERLSELQGEVSLDIFGPLQDPELWKECEQKIASLPANVTVRWHGSVSPQGVLEELSERHFFILPTLGENYGHVIIEGAAAGCPIIISNRTQWLGLSSQCVGWDIPLENTAEWRRVLQACVHMPEAEYRIMSQKASEFGRSVMNSKSNLEANVALFRRALAPIDNTGVGSFVRGVSR
ncbi:MAG: glycosyltransferase family 4 protein [Terriglobia bacterium]|nr:glycosyltransferase family 4 protein [Terriglobia bacterium]